MLTALEKRGKQARGVENVSVYHLVGRETTCPERRRTRAFSLQFSQLSPYLVMGMLEMNDAQQQRYQKAYDIAKRILQTMRIFPANDEERKQLFELDEMESGYPKMTVEHMYDVVRACAELAAGEKELDDFAACNADASDATFEVWGRRKGLWSQNNIVAYDLHSPPGILVYELREILSQKM